MTAKAIQDRGLIKAFAGQRPPAIQAFKAPKGYQPDVRPLAKDWRRFEVNNQDGQVTISILEIIGEDLFGTGVTAKRVAAALRSIGDKPVTVEINSPGGDYFEGVAIYNLLRRHSQEVTVQVLGLAASAASIVAMAGDTIQVARNSQMMIHDVWGIVIGNRHDMTEVAELFEQFDTALAETYAARSGLEVSEVMEMLDAETWLSGQDAVDRGFADGFLDRDAETPVFADIEDDMPTGDIGMIDKFLAKTGMPRSKRRTLYEAVRTATPNAGEPASPATPNAGDDVTTPNAGADALAGINRLIDTLQT